MKTLRIKDGITWVGVLHPELKTFDIIMETEFGTTYNSYIVKGNEKVALFETVKVKFFEEYIYKIKEIVDIAKIDYIVVSHTEPDHAGSVEKMLELNPNIKIVGARAAIRFLKEIVNGDFESIVVKEGDAIDLGDKTLEFIMAPFLHWPDTMYTYIKEDRVLITCDSFGAHYSFEKMLISKVANKEDYTFALKYYFDMIMGPFKPHVLKAIEKIKDKNIEMILTGHGPILDENPWDIVSLYKEWATEENIFNKKTVIIPYVSAYGYTKSIAESIEKGIKSEVIIDVYMYDMEVEDKEFVLNQIKWADGVLFGTPTINGDALPPIWDLLMNMSPITHTRKLVAAFGSYGWSGEGVPNIEARFKMLKLKQFDEGLKIVMKPSKDELDRAFEYGKRFAQAL
ncbi:MAG: FprA family A-type flavoprotein [Clostridiales bacterium]|nr:FprA family A-type flavoprotein [Clostridiales bacterium]